MTNSTDTLTRCDSCEKDAWLSDLVSSPYFASPICSSCVECMEETYEQERDYRFTSTEAQKEKELGLMPTSAFFQILAPENQVRKISELFSRSPECNQCGAEMLFRRVVVEASGARTHVTTVAGKAHYFQCPSCDNIQH